MIVVSEIGDTWSPQTAPASTADTEMIIICRLFWLWNIATTIGTSIANVPHDVPVENERNTAIANIITGMNASMKELVPMVLLTKSSNPSTWVIPLSVHANTSIVTAGII